MKEILFIIGSLRKESFNRKLAEVAEGLIGDRAVVTYLEYADLPPMNQDMEVPPHKAVTDIRRKVETADGIWIFSPEYNSSYPGHLKNLIDWLSRPLVPNDYKTPLPINGKKIALSGAGGAQATARCREKLVELLTLPFIRADLMKEPQTGVALGVEAWNKGLLILTKEQEEKLKEQVEAFLDYLDR